MRCPYCKQNQDRVIDSRASADGFSIRRRRECEACGRRFTTYERMEETPLRVVKKDGSRVPFDRSNILSGLLKACEKRPVALEELDEITSRIERKLAEEFDREVPSKHIGQLVMDALKVLDQVAYVRFASVYREFKDPAQFLEELKPMLEKGGRS
ncbi:MAG TPA: transcriptional regulator NrdR [Planctomycetota bacterium]